MKYHVFEMYGANFLHVGEFDTIDEARVEASWPDTNGGDRRCFVLHGEAINSVPYKSSASKS